MRTATYTRYSSENQREASIADQLRETRAFCASHGWPVPAEYQDAEISGERRDRPGYMRLLQDASDDKFDVLVLWDLKRLSRAADLPQLLERLRFWGVRVVTCDGYDSSRDDSDIRGWIDGLIGNRYLRDLAKATHRGLTGRALDGASAGGLPYGYAVRGVGHREIDPDQAAIVRRIFDEFISGTSPRQIAFRLNADGIPSPRGSTWALSAIRGDTKRGIGILANPIYVGRQIWNRSRWTKHPDTGRRVRQERPPEDWIISQHPELAIVTEAQWAAAQARIRGRRGNQGGAGRPARYLLSGLIRCGECGGPMVVVDGSRYGCARAKDRGVCPGTIKVKIRELENAVLGGIRSELLSDTAFQRFQKAVRSHLDAKTSNSDVLKKQLHKVERERDNIMHAIRQGIVTASTKSALETCEHKVEELRHALTETQQFEPAKILPRARERWDALIDDLADRTRGNSRARRAVEATIGTATLRYENGDLVAEIAASFSSAATATASQINMVAGAGFEPATFGL